ncbi:MAG: hypothetical protein ACJAXS_000260 [Colwellia sp.]|jgi:hypothetical protein
MTIQISVLGSKNYDYLHMITTIKECEMVNDHNIDCYKRSQIINEYQQI